MDAKRKAMGATILIGLAMSWAIAIDAGATQGGNFEFGMAHAVVKGHENALNHSIHLTKHDETGKIGCETVEYKGTVSQAKVTQFDLEPVFRNCYTTESMNQAVAIKPNGCKYRFTVAPGGTLGTMDIVCTTGNSIEVLHPNCKIVIPQQENIAGLNYTAVIDSATDAITMHIKGTLATFHFESGICVLLGTKQLARLIGSMTLWAEDGKGNRIDMKSS